MQNKELAIKLARAEKEDAVVKILKEEGLWDNYEYWRPFGDNDNNYSIIGNQQSTADASFVEKVINSIDAVLMKECMVRGIDPESADSPQSIGEAVEQFFGVKQGRFELLPATKRTEIAKNIIVAATGQKRGELHLTIADRGEGQTPARMPDTILSISKNNKLRVPFVQGKFNMGGTGALPFCGSHHLQLIISKRCPDIPNEDGDSTFEKWSVTIVRREEAREGRKSSMYTYLTDKEGSLLMFDADTLPIVPLKGEAGQRGIRYSNFNYGMYIKLYNYQLTGYKTSIVLDFYNRLSLLIPNMALPVRMVEGRDYGAHTNETTAAGLMTRLYDDRSGVVEDSFPTTSTFSVDGQKVKCSVYLLKKTPEKKKSSIKKNKEGILFMVNGQTQGIKESSFFSQVNLSYIKDSILVLVDCSEIDITHQEALFMTSRDRLRTSAFATNLMDAIKGYLRGHKALKQADYDRRAETLKEKLADNKPLKDVLQSILNSSNVLTKLFIEGTGLSSPFDMTESKGRRRDNSYEGKLHPTFFKLKGKIKHGKLEKNVPINKSFRVQYETDVSNDYFYRPFEAGALTLYYDNQVRNDLVSSCNLLNGTCTLNVVLPEDVKVGDKLFFETRIEDDYIVPDFSNIFEVNVLASEDQKPGGEGGRIPPVDSEKKGKRNQPKGLALPDIIPVEKSEWEKFNMDRFSALEYVPTDGGGDYYLNMHNDYLLSELKTRKRENEIEITKARYIYSMALIGMATISYYKNSGNEETDVSQKVREVTTMISPVLIPMLESMSALSEEDVIVSQ